MRGKFAKKKCQNITSITQKSSFRSFVAQFAEKMVRLYKRVSNRKSWTPESLNAAIEAVRSGSTKNNAAIVHGVPRQTLRKYLLLDEQDVRAGNHSLGRFETFFTVQQEKELVQYVLAMKVTLYGVTSRKIHSLAYQLAVLKRIKHSFIDDSQLAGRDWLAGFRKRHPELSLRTPEATSAARAQGFNKISVDRFYDVLDSALVPGKFPASRKWNVDETCVVTVSIYIFLIVLYF